MTSATSRLGRPAMMAVAGVVVAAAVLLLLPMGAAAGAGGEGVAVNGLARPALWLVLLGSGMTLLATRAAGRAIPAGAWLIPLLGAGLAVARMPVALVGLLLLAALVVPRLAAVAAATGWSRTLVLAGLACGATVAAATAGRQHGDETIAGLVVVGFLAAAGTLPFGWHQLRWLEQAPAELAALVATTLLPGVVAGLAAAQPVLAALHEAQRAGLLLGGFGAATTVAGALYAMGARDWRSLALRTVPGEVGLALVGVATFDIRGLQAAGLTLLVLACTRPVLFFIDAIGPRRGSGLLLSAASLLSAAGLPPTLGFPARLLVLSAAVRIHPAVAGMAVAGMVLELAATAMVLRRRLAPSTPGAVPAGARGSARPLAVVTSLVLFGGGLFPGVLVRYAFNLGG